MERLKDYLRFHRDLRLRMGNVPSNLNYICSEDFVLDRGEEPTVSAPLSESQYSYLMRVARLSMTSTFWPKQCFSNSQSLLLADFEERMEYWEGYCFSSIMPVLHGWLTLDGKVVDVTRSTRPESTQEFLAGIEPQADLKDRVLGQIPDGWLYLGVPFHRQSISEYVFEHSEMCSQIDNWRMGFPALQWERLTPLSKNKKSYSD